MSKRDDELRKELRYFEKIGDDENIFITKVMINTRAEMLKEIREIEFTNILREYDCREPNECMDKIKEIILKKFGE